MSNNILCIESSYQLCSVAVYSKNKLFSSESNIEQNHAESLLDLIQNCLQKADLGLEDLQAIAISAGPGSYTGLRIGTSTAKGICFALGIPLIAVNTLQAIAFGARQLNSAKNTAFWAMIDARRMEVYHCVFDSNLKALTAVKSGILGEEGFVPSIIDSDTFICGDGAVKAETLLGLERVAVVPHAQYLYSLADEQFQNGEFVELESFEPFYLKFANITKPSQK